MYFFFNFKFNFIYFISANKTFKKYVKKTCLFCLKIVIIYAQIRPPTQVNPPLSHGLFRLATPPIASNMFKKSFFLYNMFYLIAKNSDGNGKSVIYKNIFFLIIFLTGDY